VAAPGVVRTRDRWREGWPSDLQPREAEAHTPKVFPAAFLGWKIFRMHARIRDVFFLTLVQPRLKDQESFDTCSCLEI
jgi:hypothetical protein